MRAMEAKIHEYSARKEMKLNSWRTMMGSEEVLDCMDAYWSHQRLILKLPSEIFKMNVSVKEKLHILLQVQMTVIWL